MQHFPIQRQGNRPGRIEDAFDYLIQAVNVLPDDPVILEHLGMVLKEQGQFAEAVLKPKVTISSGDPALSSDLHHRAHEMCFIARSLNFPVRCEAQVEIA